mmetsp:Transcript_15774/g.36087  ORF Transcript_15774/g.36087 Transcript_15774/m.36087 type:complete len:84 (-) Transcript_15774:446-697(-)
MNTLDTLVDQRNPTASQIRSTHSLPRGVRLRTVIISAEHVRGNTQYPSTQTDWKIDMVAPRSCALTVTTSEPAHITTNTVVKT